MPVQTPRPIEPRGMLCPDCGNPITGRTRVCKTYASPAGIFRHRWCDLCGAAVETSEHVIGLEPEVLDVTDLNSQQIQLVRTQIEVLRTQNRVMAQPPPD